MRVLRALSFLTLSVLAGCLELEQTVVLNGDGSGKQAVRLAMKESTLRELARTSAAAQLSTAATDPTAVFDKVVVERDLVAAGMTLASHTAKTDAGVRTVALEAAFPTFAALQQSPLAGTAAAPQWPDARPGSTTRREPSPVPGIREAYARARTALYG